MARNTANVRASRPMLPLLVLPIGAGTTNDYLWWRLPGPVDTVMIWTPEPAPGMPWQPLD